MNSPPFFSIVTVTRNDAWALTKTARSVFRQGFKDFEYLVIDGASNDGTARLVEFWQHHGLVHRSISEPDSGVYDGMNKGTRQARGRFVCFLNAGDVFADDGVLARAHAVLRDDMCDGVLGWGELNGQLWASWITHGAFKLASLGFCHQALFLRRTILLQEPFDQRPGKTDSDTLQLGRSIEAGARIEIVPEVWAVRGGEPGISADLERTRRSIVATHIQEYGALSAPQAEELLKFRRQGLLPDRVRDTLASADDPLRSHLALLTIDTLFLRQSARLPRADVEALYDAATAALDRGEPGAAGAAIGQVLTAQEIRQSLMSRRDAQARERREAVASFHEQENRRIAGLRNLRGEHGSMIGDFVVSLTSFPARISTLHFVIQSLVEQTLRPREIHLWLGADEIPARHWLPKALLAFEAQGLHVHFVPRTRHQYDKYLHNAALNKDRPFVIVDDDVIYPPESMQRLLETHASNPDSIVANRCHLMGWSVGGGFAPYASWKREVQVDRPSLLAFPTGAGGVLYPAGFLCQPAVTDEEGLLAHAPYADDIWLKACALARRVPTMSTALSDGRHWYLRYTPTMREGALHASNVELGLNDMQLRRVEGWLSTVRPTWREDLMAELQP